MDACWPGGWRRSPRNSRLSTVQQNAVVKCTLSTQTQRTVLGDLPDKLVRTFSEVGEKSELACVAVFELSAPERHDKPLCLLRSHPHEYGTVKGADSNNG